MANAFFAFAAWSLLPGCVPSACLGDPGDWPQKAQVIGRHARHTLSLQGLVASKQIMAQACGSLSRGP